MLPGSWESATGAERRRDGKVKTEADEENGSRRSRKTLWSAALEAKWLGRLEDRHPTREIVGGMAVRAWRAVTICVVLNTER